MLFSPKRQLEIAVHAGDQILSRTLLHRGRYVVGQDRKNEIVLDQPSISARHARLTIISEAEMYIEDLQSANGTFVDGAPVTRETAITCDSQVDVGECRIEFLRAGLPASVFARMPAGFLRTHPYDLGNIVVQGRSSAIYEAHDTSLDRDVALKAMLPGSQSSPQAVLRFIREAQIMSQLQHPNIPPVYELSVDSDGHLFYTTRFLEGETLASVLDRLAQADAETLNAYPFPSLLAVFQKLCDGVAFAHSRGVAHRTLRPETITIGAYGEVFIMGWAFAAILDQPDGASGTRKVGAVHAPEAHLPPPLTAYSAAPACVARDAASEHMDLHALAGILCKLITLQDPIVAADEAALEAKILQRQFPTLLSMSRPVRAHWPQAVFPEQLAAIAIEGLMEEAGNPDTCVLRFQQKVLACQDAPVTANGAKRGIANFLGKH